MFALMDSLQPALLQERWLLHICSNTACWTSLDTAVQEQLQLSDREILCSFGCTAAEHAPARQLCLTLLKCAWSLAWLQECRHCLCLCSRAGSWMCESTVRCG